MFKDLKKVCPKLKYYSEILWKKDIFLQFCIFEKIDGYILLYSRAIICFMIISGSLVFTVPKNKKREEHVVAF